MPRFPSLLFTCGVLILGLLASSSLAAEARATFQVCPFETVITIPIGHACMGGGISNAKEIVDPLFAKGFVFLGSDEPVVVIAIDWCQLNNTAYDRWRDVLAEAAGTTRKRVLLATVHQHDAPICDYRAQALLDAQGMKNTMCDPEVCEKAAARTARALHASLSSPRRVTHVGIGQAKIEQLASNRRIVGPDGKINWDRTSAGKLFHDDPEGQVDPFVKTISLWDGDQPVLAWSCYSIHPMSYYGKGMVSSDFVGRARARREADDLSVFQIYFTGCAGDTTAGKYNHGLPEERPILADKLYQGMLAAWKATERHPLEQATFRCGELHLSPREGGDFTPEAQEKILASKFETRWRRITAAMGIAWRERLAANEPIDVPCLDLGKAQFMVMPAESFVAYQLTAQRLRPDSFVVVAGFGDGAPGYMPTDSSFKEGYHDSYCWVQPMYESLMNAAMAEALGGKKK